jgi:hypothetical protein
MALNFEPREGPACDDRAMTDQRPYQLGSGPLTAARVGRDALAMLRQSFVRIAAAAVIFFALPALVAALTVDVITQFVGEQDALIVIAAVVGLVIAATVRILGPVAFAGFLDQAVAKEYLHGHHSTLVDVMRRLPWRRLIAVDLIVTFVVGLGLSLLIVPGLVLYGLFGMVGPVIVQEGAGVRDSLRRTMQLARLAPSIVALLVVVPFAFEEILHEVMYETLHHSGLGVQVTAEWIVAIIVGGTLGLLEVALAAELMVRHPRDVEGPAANDSAPLLDDGQAPAV